jgi:hypothetical protein
MLGLWWSYYRFQSNLTSVFNATNDINVVTAQTMTQSLNAQTTTNTILSEAATNTGNIANTISYLASNLVSTNTALSTLSTGMSNSLNKIITELQGLSSDINIMAPMLNNLTALCIATLTFLITGEIHKDGFNPLTYTGQSTLFGVLKSVLEGLKVIQAQLGGFAKFPGPGRSIGE